MSARKKRKNAKAKDARSAHLLKPENLLTFIEMRGFYDDWTGLGLDDRDLQTLQIAIMCGPDKAPVIAETGGLRKIRFAPRRWKKGKSGAARICYAFLEEYSTILLIVAYAKNEQDTIPVAHKPQYKALIERAARNLASKSYK